MSDQQVPSTIPPGFTHLHVHSQFTLLGGTASVDDLAQRAVADGLSHLALTDTNALYGAIRFHKACRAVEVQPLIGMALTVEAPPGLVGLDHLGAGLLVLLAMDATGYRSLCRLSSMLQGRPDRHTIAHRGLDWETLTQHTEGLICLSGGRRGWTQRALQAGNRAAALRYAGRLAQTFDDRLYMALEIHRHGDVAPAQELMELGRRLGLPAVAAMPVYTLSAQERTKLRLLAAIDQNCPLEAVPAAALADGEGSHILLHWLSPAEMAQRYAAFPQAMAMTGQVASRCGPALPDGRPIWPAVKLPAGESLETSFRRRTEEGFRARYGLAPDPAIGQRLEMERAAIMSQGYASLFLLVADIVGYAREQEIPASTRGSVANSLVAHCLGITTVDPIEHDLLFERFLSPARSGQSAPDIDLDLCSRRRDQVLEWVRETYGQEHVALVATISTMRPKSALRETAKAYGLDDTTTNRLIRLLPSGWHPDPRRRSRKTMEEALAELEDPRLRQVAQAAAAIVGQPHHLSVHPGGIVVTPDPLVEVVPVQWAPKGFLITQFDHEDVEILGLPKIDLLGIRALTVLADAARLVRRHHEPQFRLDRIDLGDAATGALLAAAETIGVFQCESAGARRTLRQLKAHNVQDLAVANAFFKPGPATGGMARAFVRRYRGEEPVSYLHPALEPILRSTKGVILFQEQILRIARQVAGLSWDQADRLRRGMSKFQIREMEATQAEFMTGCQQPPPAGPGLSLQQATTLWEQVLAFAGYGFNQGHATAYADVSYRSAYLKAHWPAAFLCARLANWGGFHHPMIYIAEARRLGISVRPPHVNHSGRRFTLTWSGHQATGRSPILWMGLGQVRDLRRQSVQAIVRSRQQGPFADLKDLLRRVPLQRKEVVHLIQCGALDELHESRAGLLAELAQVERAGSVMQIAFDFAMAQVEPETAAQRLAWEQTLLGYPLSVHPLDLVPPPAGTTDLQTLLSGATGARAAVTGVRLPGWTGGHGFYLGDRQGFVTALGNRELESVKPWQPLWLQGRWSTDEWGTGWLQVDRWQMLEVTPQR